jgi:hypothetical protein
MIRRGSALRLIAFVAATLMLATAALSQARGGSVVIWTK